jgi:hypothetical protein
MRVLRGAGHVFKSGLGGGIDVVEVEVLRPDDLQHVRQDRVVPQDAPEHPLLGLLALRRQAFGGERVGHGVPSQGGRSKCASSLATLRRSVRAGAVFYPGRAAWTSTCV